MDGLLGIGINGREAGSSTLPLLLRKREIRLVGRGGGGLEGGVFVIITVV
jgi:hypothetical protein